ncbi:hypothetical protein IGI37_000999 [Enterococcus sp. AZ194]|uniref:glycosyltransferase n=1 Tax=Enterococcus sp. AZ194 TaxID=2774629 RepID=UPI003F25839A
MVYPTISVQILCRNEERVIARCLDAIEAQVGINDEIIVLDTGSHDSTQNIIKTRFNKVKLNFFEWVDDFSLARNAMGILTNKDWIFNIDCDEILKPDSLQNLKESILKFENVSDEPVVFAPKIINADDSVNYNSGCIFKNNGKFKYFGYVHEYPIYLNDVTAKNYLLVKLDNVTTYHDGYTSEVMLKKDKAKRYTELNKKMRRSFPNSDRYYFMYYRDAEMLMEKEKFELGLVNFFDIFPESNYTKMVYDKLIIFYILEGQTDKADYYLEKYWESIKNTKLDKEVLSDKITYLSATNEIAKISKTQQELLRLLINTKAMLTREENKYVENGYCFDDMIGYLLLSIGNYDKAYEIYANLTQNNYRGMLSDIFNKINLKLGEVPNEN